MFGDYETGIDEPELARYVRAINGVKAEYRSDRLVCDRLRRRYARTGTAATRSRATASPAPMRSAAATSLPIASGVTIEIRDRLRSNRIVESRLLTRHIDYDIDYLAGTLRFREPILSRASALDPQFIVADYEVDGIAGRQLNAGGRVAWRNAEQKSAGRRDRDPRR